MKPRNGYRIHNNLEIPTTAILHTNSEGREFYICGQDFRRGLVNIRYLDTGSYSEIPEGKMKPYLAKMRNAAAASWNNHKQPARKTDIANSWCEIAKPLAQSK